MSTSHSKKYTITELEIHGWSGSLSGSSRRTKNDEEIEEKIEKCMKNSRNPMSFVNTITAALLNGAVDEESVIDELERIVQKRKKEILWK